MDLDVVRAVRRAVGTDILLMADYNQSLSVVEAVKRATVLDQEELFWIEEPTVADDYLGHAHLSRAVQTPIQIGENWWGPHDMGQSLTAGASDYMMPDAMKIGGVTGWLRAAPVAAGGFRSRHYPSGARDDEKRRGENFPVYDAS